MCKGNGFCEYVVYAYVNVCICIGVWYKCMFVWCICCMCICERLYVGVCGVLYSHMM